MHRVFFFSLEEWHQMLHITPDFIGLLVLILDFLLEDSHQMLNVTPDVIGLLILILDFFIRRIASRAKCNT